MLTNMAGPCSAARVAMCALLAIAPVPAQQETHGIAVGNIDRSVKPGNDFSQYANGGWSLHIGTPNNRGMASIPGSLDALSRRRTADLIQEVAKTNAEPGSNIQKIAALYNSYMDEAAIDSKGLAPLQPHLDSIAAIQNKRELARALGETLRSDVDPLNFNNFHTSNLFGLWVAPGFKDSEHYTAYLLQGGLGLRDREFYLADPDGQTDPRGRYKAHISAVLTLAGLTDADARAGRVFELEHAIAEQHTSIEGNEDLHKANNTWKRREFAAKAPGLDWAEYFRGAGLGRIARFIVWQPTAFIGESALVASTPLNTWKDWLTFHLIETYTPALPKSFFIKTPPGMPGQPRRGPEAAAFVAGLLGDAVGQLYVQRYFTPEAKAAAQAMVTNIIAAFRKRLDNLSWMDPATRAEAQAKLTTLYVGVGYPETWRDYSAYEVKADDVFGNLWRAHLFEYRRAVARLGHPVDRKEWAMTPQTMNAVNLPLQIALNFPAAILQPPLFDPQAPAASYYGAIGVVIGHEISHLFDTKGSAIDSKGRMRNWWKSADLAHFDEAAAKLVSQYDMYQPFPDLAVNGKQTLPDNIADLGGLATAYEGYRASLGSAAAPLQDGFTGDQQFFIAFAQNWGPKSLGAELRREIKMETHSPAQYRADTVRNIDAWYSAFGVEPGETLYLAPADRVRIW
jgi:putative endopeptidase